jgi:hypothetical protein
LADKGSSVKWYWWQIQKSSLNSEVRERTGEQLDSWLKKVEASHLQAFQTFVTGVQNDKEAVLAGLTLPWSTDPLEGHINRGIRSLNAVCMVELSSTCSSFVFSIRTKRVKRERGRGRIVKNNQQIVSQNRR